MGSPAFDEDEGDVGDRAVVHEILERVGPKQDTEPSQQFEDDADREEDR